MIFGLGTDIIRIDRIAAAVARHGDRFAQRILGPQEMEKYLRRKAKERTPDATWQRIGSILPAFTAQECSN